MKKDKNLLYLPLNTLILLYLLNLEIIVKDL